MNSFDKKISAYLDSVLSDDEKQEMRRIADVRKEQKDEYLRPKYHFAAHTGRMNDPNGLCFFNGCWHLFYQNNINEKGWWWGHAISEDLIHWRDLPTAIRAEKEKECWSGMVLVEEERAIAVYYGLDTGIMIATSSDPYLLRWTKVNDGNPVIPMPPKDSEYMIFDPCIWKKGDRYCLASGRFSIDPASGTRIRQIFVFESDGLTDWKFKGPFIENDLFAKSDDDASCPYFLPCQNRHLLITFSHHSGPKIMVGDYDEKNDKFTVTGGRHLTSTSSFFGGLLAPSAFAEKDGSLKLIHNITHYADTLDQYQVMSLPRRVTVCGHRDNDVAVDAAAELCALRKEESRVYIENIQLNANEEYFPEGVFGDVAELLLNFEAKNVPMLEIRVMMSDDGLEYSALKIFRQRGDTYLPAFAPGFRYRDAHETVVMLDTTYSSKAGLVRVPDEQCFYLEPSEELNVRFFLDRSVLEVFVNGRVALAARVSPTSGKNDRVSVISRGDGIMLKKIEAYAIAE